MKVRATILVTTSLALPAAALAQEECATTHECAQQMVDALAGLNAADKDLAEAISDLNDRLDEIASLLREEIAAARTAAIAHTDTRFTALPSGGESTVTPKGRNGPTCPQGSYMVGATYDIATGDNAGSVYNGVHPVCRAFR